jgi:glutamyl/glutaminyl-tRNA synthetase
MGTSYHLSVVVDDAAQGVTHVTRGADLFEATRSTSSCNASSACRRRSTTTTA